MAIDEVDFKLNSIAMTSAFYRLHGTLFGP